jgi:hypothetical protein
VREITNEVSYLLPIKSDSAGGILALTIGRALPNQLAPMVGRGGLLCRFISGVRIMNKCRYCKEQGLVLSTINADYSCEYCGEWQSAVLNDVWSIIGYEGERVGK